MTRRGPAVVAAALALAALAGSGQASGGTADIISTVAGGPGGPGPATKIAMTPCGVSFGGGHLYIDDTANKTFGRLYSGAVREMSPSSSELTTVAGNRQWEKYANGGVATDSYLPTCGTAVDKAGNLIATDAKDERIRVVAATTGTFYGQAMTAGHIYSIAGNGKRGFSGDGGPATAARLSSPGDVTVDSAGNLVFSDVFNQRVRVVAETSGTYYGQAMTAGDIYNIAGDGRRGYYGDGKLGTRAELYYPGQVALDPAGNVLIADEGNDRVRVVARTSGTFYGVAMKAGHIYTVAGDGNGHYSGDGAPATVAGLAADGVTVDGSGNMVIADTVNNRIRVVAAKTGTFYGQAMTAGDIYTIAGDGNAGFKGDGGPATQAELNLPLDATVDSHGNVIFNDDHNHRVRVMAATTGTFYRVAMTAGNIYTIAGTGNPGHISGFGGPATSAELNAPYYPAVDSAGNVLFLDNYRVDVVAKTTGTFYGQKMTAGRLYTVAGTGVYGFSGDGGPARKAEIYPGAVTVDAAGNLVIADTHNYRVRVVAAKTGTFYGQAMTAGDIYDVAGDGNYQYSGDYLPAVNAGLTCGQVAVDASGNLMIADGGNSRIRVVAATSGTFYGIAMTAGDIYTVAGDGTRGFAGDGGLALHAEIDPSGVAADDSGNLVIADGGNYRVRVMAVTTGTFYGTKMTALHIYTVAGDGTRGFAGDGGPAASAEMNYAEEVAADPSGNLVIDDITNGRIRLVAETSGTFYGIPMTAGDIYTVAGDGHNNWSGDGGLATSSSLYVPYGVAVDPAGNLYVGDYQNRRVREVTS